MLTGLSSQKAKGRGKSYKLADSRGLHLFVTPTGHRSSQWRYRVAGKGKHAAANRDAEQWTGLASLNAADNAPQKPASFPSRFAGIAGAIQVHLSIRLGASHALMPAVFR